MLNKVITPHFVETIQVLAWYLVVFVVLVTCIVMVAQRYGPPNE